MPDSSDETWCSCAVTRRLGRPAGTARRFWRCLFTSASLMLIACSIDPAPAPVTLPSPPAAAITPLPPPPPSDTPALPSIEPSPAPLTPAQLTPAQLDALRAECVADIRSAQLGDSAEGACARFEAASRSAAGTQGSALVSPGSKTRTLPRPTPTRRPTPRPTSTVVAVNDCAGWGYGSIAYRECRAKEKARLVRICQSWSEQAGRPGVTGRELQHARSRSRAWCKAERDYRIVQ